jgi:hypothetical protein
MRHLVSVNNILLTTDVVPPAVGDQRRGTLACCPGVRCLDGTAQRLGIESQRLARSDALHLISDQEPYPNFSALWITVMQVRENIHM